MRTEETLVNADVRLNRRFDSVNGRRGWFSEFGCSSKATAADEKPVITFCEFLRMKIIIRLEVARDQIRPEIKMAAA
jgi:hypothetical protein